MAFEAVMLLAAMRDSETARRAALSSAHNAVYGVYESSRRRAMSSTSGFVNVLQDVEIDCLMNMPWEESASVRDRLVAALRVVTVLGRPEDPVWLRNWLGLVDMD